MRGGDTGNRADLLAVGGVVAALIVAVAASTWLGTARLLEEHALAPAVAEAVRSNALEGVVAGLLAALAVAGGVWTLVRQVELREAQLMEAAEHHQMILLSQMSGVMAHELRNPLASAKGHSQLLAEMLAVGSRPQLKAQYVVDELLRLERLTDKLIKFARSGHIRREAHDPVAVVRNAARQMGSDAAIHVEVNGAPGSWSLDPHAMEQVLANVLRNAMQAQQPSTEPILLTMGLKDQELHLSVRDHGPGPPPGLELFTPFVTTKQHGTGLGLAVCRQIVRAHGGSITLSSHPDGGAVVDILIPASAPPPGSNPRALAFSR